MNLHWGRWFVVCTEFRRHATAIRKFHVSPIKDVVNKNYAQYPENDTIIVHFDSPRHRHTPTPKKSKKSHKFEIKIKLKINLLEITTKWFIFLWLFGVVLLFTNFAILIVLHRPLGMLPNQIKDKRHAEEKKSYETKNKKKKILLFSFNYLFFYSCIVMHTSGLNFDLKV